MNAHKFNTMTGGDGTGGEPILLSLAILLAFVLVTSGVI